MFSKGFNIFLITTPVKVINYISMFCFPIGSRHVLYHNFVSRWQVWKILFLLNKNWKFRIIYFEHNKESPVKVWKHHNNDKFLYNSRLPALLWNTVEHCESSLSTITISRFCCIHLCVLHSLSMWDNVDSFV